VLTRVLLDVAHRVERPPRRPLRGEVVGRRRAERLQHRPVRGTMLGDDRARRGAM